MALRDEVSDPWGWLLAAVGGGVAWAAMGSAAGPVGIVAGLGVGAAVFGTKVLVGGLMGRGSRQQVVRSTPDALPRPLRGSPAAVYVERAQLARERMVDIAERPGDQWLRSEVGRMDDGADDVIASLRDLAGRVTLAEELIAAANGPALTADRSAFAAQLERTTDPMLAQERRRALSAVDQQLAGLQRLGGLRDQLLTRMATAVVGLESVATRMGEVVTLGTAAYQHDAASQAIRDAGTDLEALRTGLAEAQKLARDVGAEA